MSRPRCPPTFLSVSRRSPIGGGPGPPPRKIKKGPQQTACLTLVENPDILAAIGRRAKDRPAMVVGFAAESERLVENAQAKLTAKNCDMMVANEVSGASGVFGGENHKVL